VRSMPPCSANTFRALVTPVSVVGMDKNTEIINYIRPFYPFRPWAASAILLRFSLDSSLCTFMCKALILNGFGSANGGRTRIRRLLLFPISY
jgi:hypothetical protein